jgi:hypothetical protein
MCEERREIRETRTLEGPQITWFLRQALHHNWQFGDIILNGRGFSITYIQGKQSLRVRFNYPRGSYQTARVMTIVKQLNEDELLQEEQKFFNNKQLITLRQVISSLI